ncbi:MAG: T9SS type A sorting domain-containing protein [Bacteroidetes bacterium]|nr:T9SS type A sorting domain-containing protein [Bacteroidota bacterium]
MLSLTGQVISTWLRSQFQAGFFPKTLTLSSSLPKGLYLVKLNINQATSYHKIMIQ